MLIQRLYSILQIAVLALCCVSATPAYTFGYINEKLTSQQLIKDVDFYLETLEKTHINPFLHIRETEWRAQVEQIKSQITKQGATRQDFWLIFAPLVSSLQDRHTVVVEPRFLLQNNTTKYLPVRTVYLNGEVVVTSSVADVQIASGAGWLRGREGNRAGCGSDKAG